MRIKNKKGRSVEKTIKEATRILNFCERINNNLWVLDDENYEYIKGTIKKKKTQDDT